MNPLPLLAIGAVALVLMSKEDEEEPDKIEGLDNGEDKPDDKADNGNGTGNGTGNGGNNSEPPPKLPITKNGVVVGNWDGDMLVCVDGWKVSVDGTDCIRSFAPTGGQSAQDGDVRWDIYEEGNGWRWRAWRHHVAYSRSGWSETGIIEDRAEALARAKAEGEKLKLLDGARIEAVEDAMAAVRAYDNPNSPPNTPAKDYPPLQRKLLVRQIGPTISYGVDIYEDDLTRQDGRFLAYLVIPERDYSTIRRSKTAAQLADPDVRLEEMYNNVLMLLVNQYW